MDKNLNGLLKWSIQNTRNPDDPSADADAAAPAGAQESQLTPELINALMGGPSDAEMMQAAMSVITSADPEVSLDDKLTAFDNFEQLIESLDNANNMANLALWSPLLGMLEHEEKELRKYAAWCAGTAVQNNVKSQERMFAMGGIPKLVDLALKEGEHNEVRRKAIYALSSAVRNYQPAMDVCSTELDKRGHKQGQVDAENMDAVDEVMNALKAKANKTAT